MRGGGDGVKKRRMSSDVDENDDEDPLGLRWMGTDIEWPGGLGILQG